MIFTASTPSRVTYGTGGGCFYGPLKLLLVAEVTLKAMRLIARENPWLSPQICFEAVLRRLA